MAGEVRFVDLDDVGVASRDLFGEHIGEGESEGGKVSVMAVDDHFRQHVRAGEREFERACGQPPRPRAGRGKVERAASRRSLDDARRPPPIGHSRAGAIRLRFGEGDVGADSRHRPDEIIDHAIGFGVVRVEAVEFAVADEVDAGAFLGVYDHARRVDEGAFGGRGGKPRRDGVGSDDGCADGRGRRHRADQIGAGRARWL